MTKGPFGSDIKKSLYVPKSADTYKVYIQVNAIEKDASLGEYFISKEYFDSKMSRFEVKPNDYIITCDGTLGRYLRLPPTMERGIISASLLRITLKTNILPRFFEYLWDGYIMSRLTSDIRNSALVHLPSATKIGKVLIPLPSIDEQERIVAELDLLQGIIDKQKVQLKELDTLAQSIFYDMFGDPIANEKGWEVKTLEGISTLITDGSHYSPQNDEHGDIPMLSVKDMRQTRFSYDTCKWIGREEYAKLLANGCKPLKNDVLIAKDGSFFKYIFVLSEEREQAILSSIAILRPKTSLVDPLFVSEYLSTEEVFSKVEREYLTGTAIKRVILKGIRRLPIILPPLPLQQAFATKIEAIERQKASINASIAETRKLFDYTMDKYFG